MSSVISGPVNAQYVQTEMNLYETALKDHDSAGEGDAVYMLQQDVNSLPADEQGNANAQLAQLQIDSLQFGGNLSPQVLMDEQELFMDFPIN